MAPKSLSEPRMMLAEHGFQLTSSGHVQWSTGNPLHPRNWTIARKCYDITLILLFEAFTTAISTSGAIAAKHSQDELGSSMTLLIFVYMSTYQFGQGFGIIVFPPYSESFGRKKLYVVSAVLYGVFCAIVGVGNSHVAAGISRFMTGFLSAIPSVVITGSIADMFNARSRVWMVFLYIVATNCGLTLGPVLSAFITAAHGWEWIFYTAAIVMGFLALLLLGIKESRPSLLLSRHVKSLCTETGHDLRPLNSDHVPDLKTFARVSLFRPAQLLAFEPIMLTVSVISGVANGLFYLFTDTIPDIYQAFQFSEQNASLPFIAIALALAVNLAVRFVDRRTASTAEKNDQLLPPEHKLLGMSLGAPSLAIGLWIFAWTVPPEAHVHWFVSVFALFLVGFGLNEFCAVLTSYVTDVYLNHAASANAALSVVRVMFGAFFPLFAHRMFGDLGANVAVSVLAAIATAVCLVPPIFERFGERLRQKSKFSQYSMELSTQMEGER